MPPKATNHLNADHDELILRAVVANVLASRRNIYATPGLEEVAGNGGSRISQRVQQMLKKMVACYSPSKIVEDEVASASGKAAAAAAGGGAKKKPSPKKRKVKEGSEEVKDEDDY